jgi:hypothetical protein
VLDVCPAVSTSLNPKAVNIGTFKTKPGNLFPEIVGSSIKDVCILKT